MALPADVREAAVAQVARYCAARRSDNTRIEDDVRAVTIAERRPPWGEDFGPEWSSGCAASRCSWSQRR
jgi:hypothetical protein